MGYFFLPQTGDARAVILCLDAGTAEGDGGGRFGHPRFGEARRGMSFEVSPRTSPPTIGKTKAAREAIREKQREPWAGRAIGPPMGRARTPPIVTIRG
jgi:hypothetical protein